MDNYHNNTLGIKKIMKKIILKKKKILRQEHLVCPFKEGYMMLSSSYMCVEEIMKDADMKCSKARYFRFGQCCICGWRGVYTYEALYCNTYYYIPICRKCVNFMWGTYGNKPYARIIYNPIETNRRKF